MGKKKKKHFYDIRDDIELYPDAVIYIIIGGRNGGKTYSSLSYCLDEFEPPKQKFAFVKRTNEDVHLLCTGGKDEKLILNISPFQQINIDRGTDIKAIEVYKGIGGFWDVTNKESAEGEPIGYILSLHLGSKAKGFELQDSEVLIWDEFIPMIGERVDREEGEQILTLYKTISRARLHLGRKPLKLILLANATRIRNPTFRTLELTDTIAQMKLDGLEYLYVEKRKILIHNVEYSEEFNAIEAQDPINIAMAGTAWARSSIDNEFAYDDFSMVKKCSVKKMRPFLKIIYQRKEYWCYGNDEKYHFCTIPTNVSGLDTYNLDRENDQKLFYLHYVIDLREACVNNNMTFSSYTLYDMIVNYKKYFAL